MDRKFASNKVMVDLNGGPATMDQIVKQAEIPEIPVSVQKQRRP